MSHLPVSVLGDSQAVRMCGVWERLEGQRAIDATAARGGWTTDDLKRSLRQHVTALHQVCVLFISINDIFKSVPPLRTKKNIKTIIQLLLSHNKTIIISTLPPTLNSENLQHKIRSINIFIQSLNNPPSIKIIQFHKKFPPFSSMNLSYYKIRYNNGRPDSVHLSHTGYLQLISLISPLLGGTEERRSDVPLLHPSPPPPHLSHGTRPTPHHLAPSHPVQMNC
jgi:lysophospholipase L1-like esterase